MDKRGFFDDIYSNCNDDDEKVIELLLTRGFLIDFVQDKYYLSDNGHKLDSHYLDNLLQKQGIGVVENERIIIKNSSRYAFLENEFEGDNNKIGYEVCPRNYDWSYFRHRYHGHKVPVQDLEPFIARYVRALSSVGVTMVGSCDGNHLDKKYAFLQYGDCGSSTWHRLLCEALEKQGIRLNWKNNRIYFGTYSKYDLYFKFNNAAKIIYENREQLQKIKQQALSDYRTTFLQRADCKEIEKIFENNARVLLDKMSF